MQGPQAVPAHGGGWQTDAWPGELRGGRLPPGMLGAGHRVARSEARRGPVGRLLPSSAGAAGTATGQGALSRGTNFLSVLGQKPQSQVFPGADSSRSSPPWQVDAASSLRVHDTVLLSVSGPRRPRASGPWPCWIGASTGASLWFSGLCSNPTSQSVTEGEDFRGQNSSRNDCKPSSRLNRSLTSYGPRLPPRLQASHADDPGAAGLRDSTRPSASAPW